MSPVTILGVDPGSRTTGYGVIRMTGARAIHLASGSIRIADLDVPERLRTIFDELSGVIEEFAPNHAVVEKIFMSRNPDSALKLGQARGTAIVACAKMALPVYEYSATQIKQAVVGRGHAGKQQVQHMIKVLLNLDFEVQSDAADALAAAVCHGNTEYGMHSINVAKSARGGRRR